MIDLTHCDFTTVEDNADWNMFYKKHILDALKIGDLVPEFDVHCLYIRKRWWLYIVFARGYSVGFFDSSIGMDTNGEYFNTTELNEREIVRDWDKKIRQRDIEECLELIQESLFDDPLLTKEHRQELWNIIMMWDDCHNLTDLIAKVNDRVAQLAAATRNAQNRQLLKDLDRLYPR